MSLSPTTLRPAHYSDQQRIAQIFTSAFWDEALFGPVIHPYRNQYPMDMGLYVLRRNRVNWWDWTRRFVVTTTTDPKTNREVVTGAAQWARLGREGERRLGLRWWDPRNLIKPIMSLYVRITSFIWPNRAADPTKEDILERSFPFFSGLWSGPRAESWYLDFLAVDPAHQGKGYGRALVKWGMDQAEKEGVCASVISADGKEQFYRRCGFDVQEGRAGDGVGNPIKDVPGGAVFWKDFRSQEASDA